MKVLTAEQMRAVDRRTIEGGIPGIVLMENAGHRVLEALEEKFAPLWAQGILVVCGKGNNGGDGMVVARQLHTRIRPQALYVVLGAKPEELKGDAAANYAMLRACGCEVSFEIKPEMRAVSMVIDAVLGTGLTGPARGRAAELIHSINCDFPNANIVAVDVPSGLVSDSGDVPGEAVRACLTVTFTAPKPCHVLSPACEYTDELKTGQIGSPSALWEQDQSIQLHLSAKEDFSRLFGPRVADSNKGLYGHALVIAGARGKTGAAAMAGLAALRAGAGLVTVGSAESAINVIAAHAAELMTTPLPETDIGSISLRALEAGAIPEAIKGKDVLALGPGMGGHPETVEVIRRLVDGTETPMVVDADGLNALAGRRLQPKGPRVLTPHPGEMARLTGTSIKNVQADRIGVARSYAREQGVTLVLKGNRSVIAFPDGNAWINPTGSPAMATGGTGDILTGMLAGLIAQFPDDLQAAVIAAVYLHGRAGELGAQALGEKSFIATDLFRYLPEAMREVASANRHPL